MTVISVSNESEQSEPDAEQSGSDAEGDASSAADSPKAEELPPEYFRG